MNETKYVTVQKNGDIYLTAGTFLNQPMPNNLKASHAVLSHLGRTIHWFTEFLAGTESSSDELEAAEKKYRAQRTDDGTVFLYETRGGQGNGVGFTPKEIPLVLGELRNIPQS